MRDFGRHPEAIRRPPIAGAAVDIDPQVSQAVQTAGEGLEKTDEQVPRPELSAMCMSGQLPVESRAGGGFRAPRLMREQDSCAGCSRRAIERFGRIALLGGIEMMRAEVSAPGQHQSRAVVLQYDVFVLEHPQPQAA